MNPLLLLREAGQSVWLDFLRRGLLTSGNLEHRLHHDAVTGVTSNPTIFGRAIAGSTDYDEAIARLAARGARDPREVFYEIALDDIRMAADVFRPVHADTSGVDGYVSFELEPALAHDARGSIAAAHQLVEKIGKPNVMIKVPGTSAAIDAVEELTAAGVNVNITLLFSVDVYEQVARAYLSGLERRLTAGQPLDAVASVASFFVSRIDTAIDPLLPEGSPLQGGTAIANAKLAYQRFGEVFAGDRWERLAGAGARVQRPLWASTGTKNPAYPDVYYVEALVGRDTVDTMPEATLDAFRDHGRVRPDAVLDRLEAAVAHMALLPEHGIDFDQVTARLLDDGLAAFDADLTKLLAAIEAKLAAAQPPRRIHTLRGPRPLEERVEERLDDAERTDLVGRIWRRDHTVWNPDPTEIADRLGWLDLPETMADRVAELRAFAHQVRADGFTHAVLAGMGGSSLSADVFRRVFGVEPGALDLTVLDTTHPDAIAALDRSLDLPRTLFVAASKSGGTIETLAHLDYFYPRTAGGRQFVAITDPGTPLEAVGRRRGFRKVFLNPPDVGGRYSALSLFGLVPAALLGVDLDELLESASSMAAACHRCVPCDRNPGLWLGAVMGEAARAGWDKLTLLLPPTRRRSDGGSSSWWRNRPASREAASFPWSTRTSRPPTATAPIASSSHCATTSHCPLSTAPEHRSSGSAATSRSCSGPRSSGGSSPPPSPAACSASTPSISRTSRKPRTQPGASWSASSPTGTSRTSRPTTRRSSSRMWALATTSRCRRSSCRTAPPPGGSNVCAWRCATTTVSPPPSASGLATCTPPANSTRVARTAGCSSRSSTTHDAPTS